MLEHMRLFLVWLRGENKVLGYYRELVEDEEVRGVRGRDVDEV